jgi:hypothetical protein
MFGAGMSHKITENEYAAAEPRLDPLLDEVRARIDWFESRHSEWVAEQQMAERVDEMLEPKIEVAGLIILPPSGRN